jgi:serine/threonine protein kinase
VAIKALSLRGRGFDWKQLQLFEREARALESLSHPGIPRYIDYFEVDTDEDRGFFLVQVLLDLINAMSAAI